MMQSSFRMLLYTTEPQFPIYKIEMMLSKSAGHCEAPVLRMVMLPMNLIIKTLKPKKETVHVLASEQTLRQKVL